MTCPIGVKPDGSKADRMVAQRAKIEAGHVHLPKQAKWLDSFLLELLAFPHGDTTTRSTASRNFSNGRRRAGSTTNLYPSEAG